MNHQSNYYDHMDSHSRTPSQGEWSPPPPQFEEHDHIYTAQGSSHALSSPSPYSSMPHSPPPPLSPPLPAHHHSPPQEYQQGYSEGPYGVSTEKEMPYATHVAIGSPTPDYSGPQVVPGQPSYPFLGQPFSPSSHVGSTFSSPQSRQYAFKEHVEPPEHISRAGSVPPPVPPKEDRKCGMKRRSFCVLIGCVIFWLVALAVGLGAGLGIGLSKKNSSNEIVMDPFCRDHPKLCIGGSLDANYFTKKGAFNGSGIALAGESWNPETGTLFTLYFQHHTGDIRYMKYTKGQKWIGGTIMETVASNARNATPISAVSYAANSTQFFHVFYVGDDNMVKQVTQTNESTSTLLWTDGPLSKQNLPVYSESPSTGLQACWKGNFYGDADYKKFPTVGGDVNNIPFDNRLGMNIWYALDNSTFQQLAWYAGSPDWKPIEQWRGFNTQAGVGCYSWGTGTTQYAMMVSKSEDVEFYWKDTDTNTSTIVQDENHPYNVFRNASESAIPDVWPSTSLGYTTFFYAQSADRSIHGYDIKYNAENTTYPMHESSFVISTPAQPLYALGGTHMTVSSVSEKDDTGEVLFDNLYVFFQEKGDDITAATRRVAGGEWTIAPLKIPDS